jgi:hypothetical protein
VFNFGAGAHVEAHLEKVVSEVKSLPDGGIRDALSQVLAVVRADPEPSDETKQRFADKAHELCIELRAQKPDKSRVHRVMEELRRILPTANGLADLATKLHALLT